VNSLKM